VCLSRCPVRLPAIERGDDVFKIGTVEDITL